MTTSLTTFCENVCAGFYCTELENDVKINHALLRDVIVATLLEITRGGSYQACFLGIYLWCMDNSPFLGRVSFNCVDTQCKEFCSQFLFPKRFFSCFPKDSIEIVTYFIITDEAYAL